MAILGPQPPHSPDYYQAPDLLRLFVSEHDSASEAAAALGVARSELSTWMAWRQRAGDAKQSLVEERSGGKIPKSAWVTRAEREAAAQADSN